ncbi:MAG: tRNA epoxyqueuosine(34) reductase QueG [Deltaproteobacteria bacterium]|nr:tRNA epoxyqueuosine(34) reductase QueG [Deltaproteobacteria bacterium]
MNEIEIKETIQRLCFQEGLLFLGSTSLLDVPDSAYERFRYWLSQDYHGTMNYLNKVRRGVQEFLPWAKTVFMFGWLYPRQFVESRQGYGRIADYAVWRDYHKVFKKRLVKIACKLGDLIPQSRFKCITDAFPIMEKALALNLNVPDFFMGKNTLLIHKKFGSYFLLGEIVSNLEVVSYAHPEPSTRSNCGTCENCLVNCPNRALKDGYLDSRKCVSFWTIEYKGYFDLEKIELVHDWLFGCDVCQSTCPFNHKLRNSSYNSFRLGDRKLEGSFPLLRALSLTFEDFFNIFSGTPVYRTGHSGFIRNAIAVAYNQRYENAFGLIKNLTCVEDDVIGTTAEIALKNWQKKHSLFIL